MTLVLALSACGSDVGTDKADPGADMGSNAGDVGADTGGEQNDDPACGDGVLDAAEACDDGNTLDGDGCSAMCEVEEIVLRNLEFTLEASATCFNDRCDGRYPITFTLKNFTDQAHAELTEARLTLMTGANEYTLVDSDCDFGQTPVEIPAHGQSEIMRWEIQYNRVDGHFRLTEGCGGVGVTTEAPNFMEEGMLKVELSGLLEDGAVWRTAATSELRDIR